MVKNLYCLLITIFLFLAGCYYAPYVPQPPDKVSTIQELDKYFNELVDNGIPPGLSFVVIKNGKLVYQNAYGWADKPRNLKATPETVYHWWSVTKIATAAAILQLQERGKLELNNPVIKYLPWLNINYPSDTSKQITILNLLNHSSGIPDPGVDLVNWIHHEETPSINQTILLKKALPGLSQLIFEPGSKTSYSNTGYIALGAVIEAVSGITYEEYIRRNIFKPLKMTRTDFVYTNEMGSNEAAGAHPVKDQMTPILLVMAPSFVREMDDNHLWFKRIYTDQTPPTAIIGPVTDAARFALAFLNNGELDGDRILLDSSIREMYSQGHILISRRDSTFTVSQGLGWVVYDENGRRMVKHEGGGPGFRTIMQLYPEEKLGFILFCNDVKCETWKLINLARQISW